MGPFYSILFTLLPTVTIASVWEKYKKNKNYLPIQYPWHCICSPKFLNEFLGNSFDTNTLHG